MVVVHRWPKDIEFTVPYLVGPAKSSSTRRRVLLIVSDVVDIPKGGKRKGEECDDERSRFKKVSQWSLVGAQALQSTSREAAGGDPDARAAGAGISGTKAEALKDAKLRAASVTKANCSHLFK